MRLTGLDDARRRWGAAADRAARAYAQGDPLADDAVASVADDPEAGERMFVRGLAEGACEGPDSLRRFVEDAWSPRAFQDARRCDRGAAVLRRFAPWAALVLRCEALPRAYASPVGNKPLAMTRRLTDQAHERLSYTARFVWSTQQPGALQPGRPAALACARVRWTHAKVRARLRQGGWRADWGVPLPQADLAATGLLFGVVAVDGLRRLGAVIDEHDADAIAHLYRVVADRVGVMPHLQTDTHAQGRDHFALLTALHGPPDGDSRRLTRALMATPVLDAGPLDPLVAPMLRWTLRGLAGGLLGDLAPHLGLPRGRTRKALTGLLVRTLPAPLPGQDALIERILRS